MTAACASGGRPFLPSGPTVLVTVPTTPAVIPVASWPAAALNGGVDWEFTWYPLAAYTDPIYAAGQMCLFNAGTDGGVWQLSGTWFRIYDGSGTGTLWEEFNFSYAAGAPCTMRVSRSTNSVTLSGGLSGNGTLPLSAGTIFGAGNDLYVGAYSLGGFAWPPGVIGNIYQA